MKNDRNVLFVSSHRASGITTQSERSAAGTQHTQPRVPVYVPGPLNRTFNHRGCSWTARSNAANHARAVCFHVTRSAELKRAQRDGRWHCRGRHLFEQAQSFVLRTAASSGLSRSWKSSSGFYAGEGKFPFAPRAVRLSRWRAAERREGRGWWYIREAGHEEWTNQSWMQTDWGTIGVLRLRSVKCWIF